MEYAGGGSGVRVGVLCGVMAAARRWWVSDCGRVCVCGSRGGGAGGGRVSGTGGRGVVVLVIIIIK